MSNVNFNPNLPPPSEPEDDSERDRKVDDQKRTQQSSAFRKAMEGKAALNAAKEPPPPAAQQALKQVKDQQTQKASIAYTAASEEKVSKATSETQATKSAASAEAAKTMSARSAQADAAPSAASTQAKALAVDSASAESVIAKQGGAAGGGTGAASGASAASTSGSSSAAAAASQRQIESTQQGSGKQESDSSVKSQSGSAKAAQESSGETQKPAAKRDESSPRIDLASIVPSFPVPAQPPQHAAQPAGPLPAMTSAQLQQMVAFAMVGRDAAGHTEFHMGLSGALNGVGIHLTALGKRRVKLRLTGLDDNEGIGDAEVGQLVASLRSRDIEVVEVVTG